ncbi:MAG: glycosyltransferase [Rhodospirillales bacterium]|nr:glycosyltransferase [Rhodospirillales bacterium]
MRVLMTVDAVGGVWTYAIALAAELRKRGIVTSLACMGPRPTPAQRAEAAAIADLDLYESDFRLEWMDDADQDVLRAGVWLLALADAVKPDMVQINGYAHAAIGWQVPCVLVAHSCVRSWWHAVHGEDAPPRYRQYAQRVARGLAEADLVIAPTEAYLAELGRLYAVPARAQVIRNGIYAPPDFTQAKEPVVLGAGRLWDAGKNARALDRVAASLPWPVELAGEQGETMATSHAHRLGRLDAAALRERMARAAIFAAPALYEPFGLAILEAALSRCALVLSDLPSLRELWHGAAWFVPPDDDEALAAAIQVLIDDETLRFRLGRAARERGEVYGARQMADEMRDAYAQLLTPRLAARHG